MRLSVVLILLVLIAICAAKSSKSKSRKAAAKSKTSKVIETKKHKDSAEHKDSGKKHKTSSKKHDSKKKEKHHKTSDKPANKTIADKNSNKTSDKATNETAMVEKKAENSTQGKPCHVFRIKFGLFIILRGVCCDRYRVALKINSRLFEGQHSSCYSTRRWKGTSFIYPSFIMREQAW